MSDDDKRARWTGWLKRGDTPGTIVGYLADSWNWRVEISGTLSPDGGYILAGVTGAPPESLRVPIVDDPVTKDG